MIVRLVLAAMLTVPCRDNGALTVPHVVSPGRWSGLVGQRPITCQLCTTGIEESVQIGFINGRCRVRAFGHRRHLMMGMTSGPTTQGEGLICRGKGHRRVVPPCTPPCPPPPPPRGCC